MIVIKGCFVLAAELTYVINLLLCEGTVHQVLKHAKILPQKISDSKLDLNSYRSIALLTISSDNLKIWRAVAEFLKKHAHQIVQLP